ncbi:hypothetical protein J2Z21_002792 [Streptomyces griseochromogenes]|uniref:Uncharacterized protein n=1 Tax=Streptomyces griseochromogenes TaxID=68214 RepID=A0A1B1AXZ2_9ACTN|nr:hypothetical protein [Streptomyces griseochromogenes]ANP51407.1 hypothetical protein AVL59_18910 [Streptomyces griseochromogenes]MBP2049856.1 hypothetical protein [Streptomyces griseochromogenes]
MTEPKRSRTFTLHVEYSLFLVHDEEDYDSHPPEGIGMAYLPVARGVVYAASTVQEHETKAQVHMWAGVPPKRAEGELLGQVTLFSKSGRISVHSMMGGPEGQSLELEGPGLYGVRVYRFGGGPAARDRRDEAVRRIGDGEDIEMPTDLESYVIDMWRRPTDTSAARPARQ